MVGIKSSFLMILLLAAITQSMAHFRYGKRGEHQRLLKPMKTRLLKIAQHQRQVELQQQAEEMGETGNEAGEELGENDCYYEGEKGNALEKKCSGKGRKDGKKKEAKKETMNDRIRGIVKKLRAVQEVDRMGALFSKDVSINRVTAMNSGDIDDGESEMKIQQDSIGNEIGLAEQFQWDDVWFEAQAEKQQCYPVNTYANTVARVRKNFDKLTMMGKVLDMKVCALLCCEVASCNMAWMQGEACYSLECKDGECQAEKATGDKVNSTVLQIRRTAEDPKSSKLHSQKEVTGVKYDEHKSTIITKQAVISNTTASQKSNIPADQQSNSQTDNKQESLVTISNQSPMEQILQTESLVLHDKVIAEENNDAAERETNGAKKSMEAHVSDNIQTLSEHLKKVDEKSDMTALEENDTKPMHPKLKYHRRHDLRHSLISPIIIGAFTCMAVIAVSGFAMAIIKYQKERHEKLTNQSTQTLESN
eukprot:gene12665-13965_t